MSKKKKQKYYAIKEGKGVKNKIVRTWSECKELLLGYPSIYKTFYTEEEAIKFLGGINDKDIPAIKGVASGKCGFHTLRAFSPLIPMVCRLFRYSKVYIVP